MNDRRFEALRELFQAELRRIEQVLDARLKFVEAELRQLRQEAPGVTYEPPDQLTDESVDAFLAALGPADPERVARIRQRFEETLASGQGRIKPSRRSACGDDPPAWKLGQG